MNPILIAGAAAAIQKALDFSKSYSEATDGIKLNRLTKGLVVEPTVFVDSQISYLDFMPDVMQSLQSFFTATWLQGISVLGSPSRAEAISILEQANPNREEGYAGFVKRINSSFAREGMYWEPNNYRHGLPSNNSHTVKMAKESAATNGNRVTAKESQNDKAIASIGDIGKAVSDNVNLSVGKMVAVTIPTTSKDGKTIENEFQVRIRLLVADLAPDTLMRFVSDKSAAASFKERFFDWRFGRIGLMDLIFCNDLRKERKRQLLRDKDGVYAQVKDRQNAALRAGIASGKASAGEATNMIVISEALAQRILMETGLDLDDYQDRQKVFEATSAMVIVRVNPVDLRVRFYQEDSKRYTSLGVNELRSANRKNGTGPNIMELFENLQSGNPIRF